MLIRILKGLLLTIVVLFALLAAALGYLFFHQELLTKKVEELYEERYAGELSLGKVSLSSWKQLPALTLRIDQLRLTDTSRHASDIPTLQLDNFRAELSLAEIFQKKVILKKLVAQGGHFQAFTAADGRDNLGVFRLLDPEPGDSSDDSFLRLPAEQRLLVELECFELRHQQDQKNKRFAGQIERLISRLTFSDSLVSSTTHAEFFVDGLGFNLEKGVYLEETVVSAQFSSTYDREHSTLEVPQFPLQLDQQTFLTEACLDLSGGGPFFLSLMNEQTNFNPTKGLLPRHLQNKLRRYDIDQPIASNIYVRGEFLPNDNPWAHIDFTAPNNTVVIADSLKFDQVQGSGSFANRIYTDPTLARHEDRENLKLTVDQLRCEYLGAQLLFTNSTFTSTPEVLTGLDLQLSAEGRLEDLNVILGNENFFFAGGKFKSQLTMEGPAENLEDILKSAAGHLHLHHTQVKYLPAGVTVPLTELEVILRPESALVPKILIPLAKNQEIKISGKVTNFSSLIFVDQSEKVTSEIDLYSADLNLDHFLDLLASLQEDNTPDTTQFRLAKTMAGIYHTFQPQLALRIDHFAYQHLQARDINASLAFLDDQNLALTRTTLFSGQSEVSLDGRLSVPDSAQFIHLAMNVAAHGSPEDFNTAFDNDTFFFREGDYRFRGRLQGAINDWQGLLYASQGHLEVQNTNILFAPEQLHFQVAQIDLEVAQRDIDLKNLELTLPSGGAIQLSGQVNHFLDLLTEEETPLVSSFLRMRASYLDYADFSGLFTSLQEEDETPDTTSAQNQLKGSLQNLYQKFFPELDLKIDSFRHDAFLVTKIRSKVNFQDSKHLQFADLGFEYRDSPVRLNAILGIDQDSLTPLAVELETEYFDLATLVETYDYFGLPALQKAGGIAGKVSLNAELSGHINDASGFDPKSLLGSVQFTLHEAELKDFGPIQAIADKFFRTERFETIRFAPVTDTLFITQEVVHIPRMEIQSTAFNLFVEGHLNYDNNTNIWISVPWKNFTNWEEKAGIPTKTGYYQSGPKLYVQVVGNEEDKLDYKFRLRKKKLYEHQAILPLYKHDRRYERKVRRQLRKQRRQAKREARRDGV